MAQTGIETFFAVGGTKSQFEMYKARELRRVQTQLTAQGKEIVNIIEGPITRPLTGWSQDIKVIWKTTEVKPIHTVTTPQAKPTTEKVSVTSDNFNSILERIDLFLEDKNWEKAIAYCESALDFDPKNASVYLKYLLADCKCSTFEELLDSNNAFEKNSYYQKVLRFGDEDFTSNLKESILRSKNQKELNRCNNIYNQAKSLMSNTNPSIDELESAVKLFNDIKHFKDSSEQIRFCQNRVSELKDIAEKERMEQEERERLVRLQEQREKEEKQKKIKTISLIVFVIVSALATYFLVMSFIITPNNIYNKAMAFMAENNYDDALEQLNSMEYPCKDSEIKKQECHYFIAKEYEELGKIKHAAIAYGKAGDYKDAKEKTFTLWNSFAKRNTIDDGFDHIVSLKQDGSVVAAGRNDEGECNTDNWTDIIAVATGDGHTVGLKADGSVVVTGDTYGRNQNIMKWNNVVEIHAIGFTTVGLKSDGTVVAEGDFKEIEYEKIHNWTDIVEVYVDTSSLAGLKSDGTVVAVGDFEQVEYEKIGGWSDIIKAAIYRDDTLVGLKSDGTVVAVGDFEQSEHEEIQSWSEIIDIYVTSTNIVGLKSNGTVVAVGDFEQSEYEKIHSWTNVVEIYGDSNIFVALKSDGTTVVVGSLDIYGSFDDWENIIIQNDNILSNRYN